jgi:hypothetical protein
MDINNTHNPQPSIVRAVIEWHHGLNNVPTIYAVADTAEESELVEKLLAEKLGDHDDVAR